MISKRKEHPLFLRITLLLQWRLVRERACGTKLYWNSHKNAKWSMFSKIQNKIPNVWQLPQEIRTNCCNFLEQTCKLSLIISESNHFPIYTRPVTNVKYITNRCWHSLSFGALNDFFLNHLLLKNWKVWNFTHTYS